MNRTRIQRKQNDHLTQQQTLIRRALLGLDYWLRGRAFRMPFCDYLKILLHKPESTIITLWKREDTRRPLFSTHPEIETNLSEEFAVTIPHSELVVACYCSTGRGAVGDPDAKIQFGRLFAHPEFINPYEGKLFAETLTAATSAPVLPKNNAISYASDHDSPEENRDWETAYKRVFTSINKLLEDLPHFRIGKSSPPSAVNLFPFVFAADISKAAQITHQPQSVLTAEQNVLLSGHSEDPEILAKLFSHTFGKGADEAFRTGTVVLAAPAKNLDLPNSREWLGFQKLALMDRIYVPIHVEGSPWIVLLRFLDSEVSHWYDTFHFYNDVIPRVGAMLRTEAKALYLDLIERIFVDEIAKSDLQSLVVRFNKQSKALLRNLPFPRVYLTEKPGTGVPLDLPDGRRVHIGTEPNPYFNPEWTYDPLGGLDTKEACERAKAAFANEEERVRARFLGHRHSIINLKPGPLLHAALIQGEEQLSGKARTFVADAEKTTEVLFASLDFVMTKMHGPLRGRSIAGILIWLKNHETSGVGHASLEIDSSADFLPHHNAMEDVFLVFWNLWHNAAQRGNFSVHVGQYDGVRRVVFFQESEWPQNKRQWVHFLNGVASSPNTEPEKRGLEIVDRSVRHLLWKISAVAAPAVKITIEIPQK